VFLKQALAEHPEGVTIFPPETFYYEPSFEPPKRPDDFPQVYAVHHELESYVALPPAETLEQRFDMFAGEAARALDVLGSLRQDDAGAAAQRDALRARLDRLERRMRRAIGRHEHCCQARLRQAEAGREQIAVRLMEAERESRLRLDEIRARLEDTAGRLARLERRSIVSWARKLLAPGRR
jgi:hypothetical protein